MSLQLFGERIQSLHQGLDFGSVKNRVIASNIANIETPGYKAFKVVLEEKRDSVKAGSVSLTQSHPQHLDGKHSGMNDRFQIAQDDRTTMRPDGNNVDLERELAEMSANSIYFTALSRFIAQNFAGLKSVISEGKR